MAADLLSYSLTKYY